MPRKATETAQQVEETTKIDKVEEQPVQSQEPVIQPHSSGLMVEFLKTRKMEFQARMECDPNFKLQLETEATGLKAAKKMLEDNQSPASPLQIEIIKTATELIKVCQHF